jgi:hypothetical protein
MQDDPDLVNANIVALIKPRLELAHKYYSKMEEIDAHVISMCRPFPYSLIYPFVVRLSVIDRPVQFEWIRKNWNTELQAKARQVFLNKALVYPLRGTVLTVGFQLRDYREEEDASAGNSPARSGFSSAISAAVIHLVHDQRPHQLPLR